MSTATSITRWEGGRKVRRPVRMVDGLGWERTQGGVYEATIEGRTWTLRLCGANGEGCPVSGWYLFSEPRAMTLAGTTLDEALAEATRQALS